MRGVVELEPKRSPSTKNRTLPTSSTGTKKSRFNRVGRTDTVEFVPPPLVGTGMLEGMKRSVSPAGRKSRMKSFLKYPPIFKSVFVPGSRKYPGKFGSSGELSTLAAAWESCEYVS